jgi:transposase
MSRMAELDMYSYDIEQLFLEGLTEKNIAKTLDISVEEVYAWMKLNGIEQDEIYSPYNG